MTWPKFVQKYDNIDNNNNTDIFLEKCCGINHIVADRVSQEVVSADLRMVGL